MLKSAGLHTILEEKILSTEVIGKRYPKVWEIIKFHKFEAFTAPRDTYVPSLVREFYEALEAALPKMRRELKESELVDVVQVRGKMVKFNTSDINDELGCPNNSQKDLDNILKESMHILKEWLALLATDSTPSWIAPGVPIEKRELNVVAKYWFTFMSSTLMPIQK